MSNQDNHVVRIKENDPILAKTRAIKAISRLKNMREKDMDGCITNMRRIGSLDWFRAKHSQMKPLNI